MAIAKFVEWNDLSKEQQSHLRDQYVYLRMCEDEITEEEVKEQYDLSDERMSEFNYVIEGETVETTPLDRLFIIV